MKKILTSFVGAFGLLLVVLISLQSIQAASVGSILTYDTTNAGYAVLTQGDSIGVSIYAYSILEKGMTIDLDLLSSSGTVVRNDLVSATTTMDEYDTSYTVRTDSSYKGIYTLRLTVRGKSGQIAQDKLTFNVRELDSDNDGVGNSQDICPGYNDNVDRDNDGIPDGCDPTPNGDNDNDGIDNSVDNCINVYNPGQENNYGDGIGDACRDTDGDGVLDINDNCIDVYNPGQENNYGDGRGDACETPIVPSNSAPTISSIPDSNVSEGTSFSYQVSANDSEGDSLTYSITGANWTTISSTGLISGTAPLVSSDSAITLTVTVSDGSQSVSASFILTVLNDTIPPVVSITNPLPSGGAVDSRTTITYNSDEALASASVSVDNINWIPVWSGVTTLGDIPEFNNLSDGSVFTLYLNATDSSGNVGLDSVTGLEKGERASSSDSGPTGNVIRVVHDSVYDTTNKIPDKKTINVSNNLAEEGFPFWLLIFLLVILLLVLIVFVRVVLY